MQNKHDIISFVNDRKQTGKMKRVFLEICRDYRNMTQTKLCVCDDATWHGSLLWAVPVNTEVAQTWISL